MVCLYMGVTSWPFTIRSGKNRSDFFAMVLTFAGVCLADCRISYVGGNAKCQKKPDAIPVPSILQKHLPLPWCQRLQDLRRLIRIRQIPRPPSSPYWPCQNPAHSAIRDMRTPRPCIFRSLCCLFCLMPKSEKHCHQHAPMRHFFHARPMLTPHSCCDVMWQRIQLTAFHTRTRCRPRCHAPRFPNVA